LIVGDKSIITSYVLNPILKIIFPSERSAFEQNYLEHKENKIELSKTAAMTFYTLTSKKSNLKSISKCLKGFHTDVLLRFYAVCVERGDHVYATYTALSILNLIQANYYKFPTIASRYIS